MGAPMVVEVQMLLKCLVDAGHPQLPIVEVPELKAGDELRPFDAAVALGPSRRQHIQGKVESLARDGPFRVQPFEGPHQQHPDVSSGAQTRPPDTVGVKPRAQSLHEGVEPRFFRHPIKPLVEGVPRTKIRRNPPVPN